MPSPELGIDLHPTYPAELHALKNLPLIEWPAQWQPSDDFPTPQSVGTDEFSQAANDALSFSGEPTFYRLGNPGHGIAPFRRYTLDTIRGNQVTIIDADLGIGKSTGIPLSLLEEYLTTGSDKRLYVTSPRKLPTKELQEYVQSLLPAELKPLIGRATGNAEESDCHPDARVIFGTERLLLRKLMNGEIRPYDDLMIDEAHEATTPMTVLAGVAKLRLPQTPDRRIIISSGTSDNQRWARHMADVRTGKPAPIIGIKGRNFAHEFIISDKSVAEVAREQMKLGLNVVAFEPGSARMNETASRMAAAFPDEEDSKFIRPRIFLLHGDQSPREQAEALNPAPGNHLVANKVGETSITPEGKDVVVSSGVSNIGMYEEGVHILATVHSSKSAIRQQGGRVSRMKAGKHFLAVASSAPPIDWEDRPDFDPPAIQCESVASEIAEVLTDGLRLEDLPLMDHPVEKNLRHDYKLLGYLGAIARVGENYVLTDVGHKMLTLPVSMPQARSIVEAGEIEDSETLSRDAVRLQACAIAAIQEEKGILEAWNNGKRREQLSYGLKNGLSEEKLSDPLFELEAFIVAYELQRRMLPNGNDDPHAVARFERFLRAKDIKLNPYYKSMRTFRELCRREGLEPEDICKPNAEERAALLRCQIVGAEELFVKKGGNWYWDRRGVSRQLGIRSTVFPELAEVLVGSPFNLRGMTDRGTFERRYISGASAVAPEDIIKFAGHRVTSKSVGYGITFKGQIRERRTFYFDGMVPFHIEAGELTPTLETRELLIRTMMTGASLPSFHSPNRVVPYDVKTPNAKNAIRRWREAQNIEDRTLLNLNVDGGYENLIKKIVRESVAKVPLDVTEPELLDEVIPNIYPRRLVKPSRRGMVDEILEKAPDFVTITRDDKPEFKIPVGYKDGIAYIYLPAEFKYKVSREDFAELRAHHNVKVKIGGGHARIFDDAFALLDAKRLEQDDKRERRAQQLEESRELAAVLPFERKKWRIKKNGANVGKAEADERIKKDSRNTKRQERLRKRRENRSNRRRDRRLDWAVGYAE